MLRRLSLGDMRQLFPGYLQKRAALIVATVGEAQAVAQERDACLRLLAQIILPLARHDHLRLKGHLPVVLVPALVENAAQIRHPPALVAHGEGGVDQRSVRQGAQERDRVEQIGFAGAIGPGDARERTEVHVVIDEILEARHLEPCQHGNLPLSTIALALSPSVSQTGMPS